MEGSMIQGIEQIIGYTFTNKKLLEEAFTHSSLHGYLSYERLEFIGNAILSLAITNYLYLAYPLLEPSQLSLLRAANVSTERLARVAVRHNLHRFVLHNENQLIPQVQQFVDGVGREHEVVPYGGSIKAPKVLADVVEAVAGAIYVDLNFDINILWMIFRDILEPIVTPNDLEPQQVTMLFELCQKNARNAEIKVRRNEDKTVAEVFVDGVLVSSASSEHKHNAKLEAAKVALDKLSHFLPSPSETIINTVTEENDSLFLSVAKDKLFKLCLANNWTIPVYTIEKESGPPHDKKFLVGVEVKIGGCIFEVLGDEQSRKKHAKNSAAYFMIKELHRRNYV